MTVIVSYIDAISMIDAITFTIGLMADHFDRGLGLSDARIERFKGMVG